ncbi:Serine threonine kinase [Olea europaea subsp. europaea]|uniref:Serine threonine kinase n=1 Tax=Olea europaea subsp. europaea TaxID=158383 RepID=A0A8S0V1J9_OLEEU|nr:Serine threonine kinase [Olea europaea subsp. europaea]
MSYKSDIYSYGMMVLEMAGAKKIVEVGSTKSSENYFPDQVYELIVVRETMKFDEFMSREDKETARKMFLVTKAIEVEVLVLAEVPLNQIRNEALKKGLSRSPHVHNMPKF